VLLCSKEIGASSTSERFEGVSGGLGGLAFFCFSSSSIFCLALSRASLVKILV